MSLLTRWVGDNVQISEAHTPTERLNTMAQGINDLTRLSEADLQAFARTELANWQASQAGHFRRQLAQAPALQSANWQQYLERGHEEAFTALQQTPSLDDLLAHPVEDSAHTLSLVRSWGQRLSNALKAWPLLWAAAAGFDFQ